MVDQVMMEEKAHRFAEVHMKNIAKWFYNFMDFSLKYALKRFDTLPRNGVSPAI